MSAFPSDCVSLLGFTYGNGVAATFGYSANRTQLSSLTYTKGSSIYFNQQYWYKQDSQNCPNGTSGNNGSIQCVTDLVDSGRTVNYGYDLLGRMISAKTNGSTGFPQWGMIESYDRFGNRWDQTATAGSVPQPQLTFGTNGMNSSMTNRPNGYTFDPSGNMTVEPFSPPNDMTYDGENQMTAFSGAGGAATYTYDGNGLRVIRSVSGGATTVSIFSGNSVIAEYDNGAAPSAPSREYVYNGAPSGNTTGLLAMISDGATTYYHQDDESVRLTTDGNGNVVTQEGTFPFGETWYMTGQSNKWIFTSYNQDSESGLNYALARYYYSRTGTFCSADPLAGSPDDPQSWNRYPYGRNDPIDITDPSGKNFMEAFIKHLMIAFGGPVAAAFFITEGALDGSGPPPPSSFSIGASSAGAWNDSFSVPYGGLTNGIQRALGLPTMNDVPGPVFDADSVEAYHPSKWTWGCFGRGLFAATADLTGISMVPDADPDHWRWSSAKFGFVYVEPEMEQKSDSLYGAAVGGLGTTADYAEKTASFFHDTPHAKQLLRQFLRNNDVRVSSSEFSATAGTIGKYAGRVAKVVGLYDGYEAWAKCKQ